jgi:hypothetical protein
MRSSSRLFLIPLFIAASASPALAAWPNSPFTNRALCTAANNQQLPTSVSDGAGGAIVTWQDLRNGANLDIYAQHVLASGAVDPAWPADGRALCTAANYQMTQTIVSDGAGGAIVAWQDFRNGGNFDIYAQHVLASGAVDGAWPIDGRALCTNAAPQQNPTIVASGAGGAIVTWSDLRNGVPDIYAQHVLASGAVDGTWPADGRAVCTFNAEKSAAVSVSDGAGGAIVTWQDLRALSNYDIYAQHLLASGVVDPGWPVDGRALCTAASNQQTPTIVADGAGGAIVTWQDRRNLLNYDIYAQHVLASGAVDGSWPADGRALCTASSDQTIPVIVTDGAGGAVATWNDQRNSNYDIFAQHVLASGAVDPAWPTDGRALCTLAGQQSNPAIVPDGASGTFVSWHDFRNGNFDIYAQHVLASGAVDGTWPADGRALSTAAGEQSFPTIVSDGAGGAIVAWQDVRSGSYDIYAQRVARYGYLGTPEAEIVSVKDVPNDQGGKVKLSWNASYLDLASDPNLATYDIWRSVPPNVAAARVARGERIVASYSEALAGPGRMWTQPAATQSYAWEYVTTQAPYHYISAYSVLAPTAQDSTAAGAPTTAFMVVARNTNNTMYWLSIPASGYSVDNLPPAAPAPFTGQYSAGSVSLHWNPNTEADLAGYRLYRGTSASFVPGPLSLVAALPDTGYTDNPGAPGYYKLTAVDSHGNQSPVATLLPSGTTSVGDAIPAALAFALPSPNPADARTTLQYTLPRAGTVRLGLYDASGRLVRELASGTREAGPHTEAWNLRDESGRAVGAGLYFARLDTQGRTLVRKVAVTR